jgi:hypothetical protein
MTLSAFGDKAHQPTDADLRATLGAAHGAWADLIALVSKQIPPITETWGFTSKSTGWGLRLLHKERVLLYMTPCAGRFLVSFALGEKAVAAARAAKLPSALLEAIDAAPRYAEGRGVRIPVEGGELVPSLAALARIKHEH